MELWVTLGLLLVLGSIGGFLAYFISGAMNFDDSSRVDPPNKFDHSL